MNEDHVVTDAQLAAAVRSIPVPGLYEPDRKPFAKKVRDEQKRMFTLIDGEGTVEDHDN